MKSFLKLIPFIRPQWRLILISLILSLPMSAISASPALLIQYLIDKILVKKPEDTQVLVFFAGAVIGIYLVNMVVRFFFGYTAKLANENVMRDIREKLFSHFIGLSSSFFTESSVGSLMSRVMNDVFYVSQGIVNLSAGVRQIFTFIGTFGYAIYLNAKLMMISLLIAPLLIWLSRRSSILMKGYMAKMQEYNGLVFSTLQESFSGFKVIKSFCLEGFAFLRFKRKNDEYVKYALKAAKVEETMAPAVELMAALAIAGVVYVGGRDVIHGRLTPGELGAFFACFALMINPVRTLNDILMKFSQAGASADRIEEALSIKSPIVEASHFSELKHFTTAIEFQNVSFSYSGEPPYVFQNISFKVPQGKSIAIVGASGQGKSTLVSLLPRFYDPSQGSILIDGKDLREFSLSSLRSMVSVVSQDVFLFNDTVANNICAGAFERNVSELEIKEAARAAYAMDFIEKMPLGFDTVVGERGVRLSGGERQRISIARALLKNAPILILDEATSSLDNQSEQMVQRALDALMKGRTTIVIAHRLSTIRNVDEILVMAGGKIVERGNHQSLIETKGVYHRFYELGS